MPAKKRGPKPAPPIRIPAALLRRYIAGELGRDRLAAELDLPDSAVRRELVRLGVYRDKSAAMTAHFAATRGDRRRRIIEAYRSGLTQQEIADREGCGRCAIWQIIRKHAPELCPGSGRRAR